MEIPEKYRLSSYYFHLPEELIAQYPPKNRGESRLLVLDRKKNEIIDTHFRDLVNYLPPDSLLVFNQSRVFPARLYGKKETGGKAEVLILTPLPLLVIQREGKYMRAEIEALIRPSRGMREGKRIYLGEEMYFVLNRREGAGRWQGALYWVGELYSRIKAQGNIPLPPYIRRLPGEIDQERYQTIFSREDKCGSVAAPTAGLHFNEEIFSNLSKKGIRCSFITLYVGHGTFSPVRNEDIRVHQMHKEYVEISEKDAKIIEEARREGRRIIAVGTTSVRTLEGVSRKLSGKILPFKGWIDLYIYPDFNFKVVDHMITNFHLPGSSLILMVSAFTGRSLLLRTYKHAVTQRYRFFSYGDAMLIL